MDLDQASRTQCLDIGTMKAAMMAAIYTEEMAMTAYYARVAGVFEPMPEEGIREMKELIAADQAV